LFQEEKNKNKNYKIGIIFIKIKNPPKRRKINMEEKKKETITELKNKLKIYKIAEIIVLIILIVNFRIIAFLIIFIFSLVLNRYMEYKIQRRYDEILEDNHDNLENIEKNTRKD